MANNRMWIRNKRTGEFIILAIKHLGDDDTWEISPMLDLDRLSRLLSTDEHYGFEEGTDIDIKTENDGRDPLDKEFAG